MTGHRMIALALVAAVPGCMFIVPKDRLKEGSSEDHWDPTPVNQRTLAYNGRPNGTAFEVWASWQQMCDWTGTRTTLFARHTGATLKVFDPCGGPGDGCAIALVFAVLAAPVTLVVSGLVTATVVVADHDDTVSKQSVLPARRDHCDVVAPNITLSVVAPGHDPALITTDAQGRGFIDFGDAQVAATAQVSLVP